MSQYCIFDKKYEELLSLDVIKRHLWVEGDPSEDETLKEMLKCAIDAAESFLRRCIVAQTVLYRFKISSNSIRLPMAFAVEFVNYKEADKDLENPQNLMSQYDATENKLELESKYKSITEIKYIAGWNQGDVPQEIKQGVLQHIYNMHHKQSPALMQNNDSIELYQPYRKLAL
jgi:hypothetical protein